MYFVLTFLACALVSASAESAQCTHKGKNVKPGYRYFTTDDDIPKQCECETNWHTYDNFIVCRPIGCLKDGKFFIAGEKKMNCECVPGVHPDVQDAGSLFHWRCVRVCTLGNRQFDIDATWYSNRFQSRHSLIPVECTCTKAAKVICKERGCRKNNRFYQDGDVMGNCRCARKYSRPRETWERLYQWIC